MLVSVLLVKRRACAVLVVPGTPRDSLFILDTLLNLDAGPKPEVVTTDNASYSDMVFGVVAILNYRFAPRFADLPDQRYWRAALPDPLPDGVDRSLEQQAIGGYGALEPIARNTVNVAKIATQWPDMLRVAGSLVTNQVRAYDLLRMFGRDGHPTPLGQAFIEYGLSVMRVGCSRMWPSSSSSRRVPAPSRTGAR
jgi:TnpA family transposase